jgi:type I restriction-modification system DNA methylase subunit
MDHKKEMIKYFMELSSRHNLWTVYSDFLEVAAISIRNSVDFSCKDKSEENYKKIMGNYNDKEKAIFPKIFGELSKALETPGDYLGQVFMELELGNKWKGQFFTPYHLCLLTAKLSLENIEEKIKERGYIELNEPSCGGGALIIAVAQVIKEKGFNPQRQLRVTAQDLDMKSVYMAYIQLSLLGIPAQVCHANTLSLEVFDIWETPFYVLGGWKYKKHKESIKLKQVDDGQLKLTI